VQNNRLCRIGFIFDLQCTPNDFVALNLFLICIAQQTALLFLTGTHLVMMIILIYTLTGLYLNALLKNHLKSFMQHVFLVVFGFCFCICNMYCC